MVEATGKEPRIYGENRSIFACDGMLFNHGLLREGSSLSPRQASNAAAKVALDLETGLSLGNLESGERRACRRLCNLSLWLLLQRGIV